MKQTYMAVIPTAALVSNVSLQDQQVFQEMITPLIKIYQLAKYSSTIIAALFILYAGIIYITSGGEPMKREMAKNIFSYVLIGLLVIWATPYILELLA